MDWKEIQSILCEKAQEMGVSEYEIYYMTESGVSAEALADEISAFSSSVVGGVSFRCVEGGRIGAAATELLTKEALESLVVSAVENAKALEGDEDADLFHGSPAYAKVSVKPCRMPEAGELCRETLALQRKAYALSPLVSEGTQSSIFASSFEIDLMNSHGLDLCCRVGVSGGCVDAVVRRDEEAEDHYKLGQGVSAEELTKVAEDAVSGAVRKLGAEEIPSGSYDIIFSPRQMRALLSTFSPAFSAKNAQMGLSLLAGKEGESIASDCVSIVDDPMREGCPMQTSFDGEGVATFRKSVVKDGVLQTLLYDRQTAKKAGRESTANGQRGSYATGVNIAPYSFYLEAGDKSSEELLASVEKGIYITELKGLHAGADAVTGDFSIESAGILIENGKKTQAVKSFTVAGNFFELLKDVEALSNEIEFGFPSGFTVFGAPEVLLRNMSVAGK